MSAGLVALSFAAIALMRVAQKVCSKKVSAEVQGKTFFHYGGYYNLLSALFSLVTLFMVGCSNSRRSACRCYGGTFNGCAENGKKQRYRAFSACG